MLEENDWRLHAKCRNLTPAQADALFFPGSGGKSGPARRYCETCPVLSTCLTVAIASNQEGFVAGESYESRKEMARFVKQTTMLVFALIQPPEPKRRVLRALVVVPDPHEWLMEKINSPLDT